MSFSVYSINYLHVNESGQTLDFWAMGFMIYGMVVVVANLKVFVISFDHTPLSIFFNLGSMVNYLITIVLYDGIVTSLGYGMYSKLMNNYTFHIGNILIVAATSFVIDFSLERMERVLEIQRRQASGTVPSIGQIAPEIIQI
mmetsp:Transcript_1212/g.174  ORF Transcript_1212/g.174 Transcript_1212/m.174 type:complete len:142 (-) Transcript_1212:267-692(-)